MAVHTLASTKALEAPGLDRKTANAHAEALTGNVLPDLVSKADLAATKVELEQTMERIERRLTLRLTGLSTLLTRPSSRYFVSSTDGQGLITRRRR